MAEPEPTFEGWAILELMGHRRLGGRVSEVEFAGGKFVRIDIPAPAVGANPAGFWTQLYGASAVYCLTPTTEAIARAAACSSVVMPVSRWELTHPTPAVADVDDEWGPVSG